jgi:uncharacterized HhH-GPD family protein
MEKAFKGPAVLRERLGHLDAARIADTPAEEFTAAMATPPGRPPLPGSMATRLQDLCRTSSSTTTGGPRRSGRGSRTAPSCCGAQGAARLRRPEGAHLPGPARQAARVQPAGWREAAGPYGEDGALRSVADVVSPETLLEVRAYKQSVKAAAKRS